MARKVENIGVLQADSRRISYLRARADARGIAITGHFVQEGHWALEDGTLAAALQGFAAEYGLAEDEIYSVLPRHEITCRVLAFPSHDEGELRSMVQLSAEEYVPFGAEEIIVDQAVLKSHASGESDILAVFAHKDLVLNHLGLLRKASIEPTQILLTTACLASAALQAQAAALERFAIADLGATGFEFAIFQGNQLRYTRGIAGAHDWSETVTTPGGAMDELAIELRSSLSAYRRESPDGIAIDHIFLSGEAGALDAIAAVMASETAKECAPAEFARALVESGGELLKGLPLIGIGGLLAARQQSGVKINLLPEDVERDRALVGAKSKLKRGAILVVLLILGVGLAYGQSLYQRYQFIKELEAQRDAIAPMAEGVAQKQAQLQTIRQQVEAKGSVLELLGTIVQAAPEGEVNISRFAYDREDGIDFWGRSKSVDKVHEFSQAIRNLATGHLAQLASAVRMYENKGTERNEQIFEYQISIPFPEEDVNASTEKTE